MLKDVSGEFEYKGKVYKIVFNLNVMEEIQEKYKTIAKWGELTDGKKGEPNAQAVIFAFTAMINEAIDIENEEKGTDNKFLTHKQVGRIVTGAGMKYMSQKLSDTVIASTKSDEKNA